MDGRSLEIVVAYFARILPIFSGSDVIASAAGNYVSGYHREAAWLIWSIFERPASAPSGGKTILRADANRLAHGQPKHRRKLEAARQAKASRDLDQHRIETGDGR